MAIKMRSRIEPIASSTCIIRFCLGLFMWFSFYTPAAVQRIVGCKIEGSRLTLFVKSCYFTMKWEGESPNCFLNDLLNENTSANPQ